MPRPLRAEKEKPRRLHKGREKESEEERAEGGKVGLLPARAFFSQLCARPVVAVCVKVRATATYYTSRFNVFCSRVRVGAREVFFCLFFFSLSLYLSGSYTHGGPSCARGRYTCREEREEREDEKREKRRIHCMYMHRSSMVVCAC